MANEITASVSLKISSGVLKDELVKNGVLIDTESQIVDAGVQVIGTGSHESLLTGETMTRPGWAAFVNLDDTNLVDIGVDVAATFYPLVEVPAGKAALFKISDGIDPYAKATGGNVMLQKLIIDEVVPT